MTHIAYIGHYTDESRIGIRTVRIDVENGSVETLCTTKADNAIWMVQDSARSVLYSTCDDGLVAYHAHDDGSLAEFSRLELHGLTAPCHASISPDGTRLAWAEYRNGTIGLVSLAADGSLLCDTLRTVRHEGRGPISPRQDSPHAHCVRFSPDGTRLFAVDLGLDEVKAYDPASLVEIAGETLHASPGYGPRHLVFHPSGRLAAIDFELANSVALYRFAGGMFEEVANISTLPDGYAGQSQCAAVKFSEDGRELYVSNRGHDSLAVFAVDEERCAIELRGIIPLGGSFPRDFAFAPGGGILAACLKKSGVLRTYAYDRAGCRLAPLSGLEGLCRPLFVMFRQP